MPEISLNDADLRVLHRLRTELDAFDLGMTDVPALIEMISGLLDQFEDLPPSIAEELRTVWWPVQYALALSRDEDRRLSEEEEIGARDAVALLQRELANVEVNEG